MGILSAIIGTALFYALLPLLFWPCFSGGGAKKELRLVLDAWKRRSYAYCACKRKEGFTLIELSLVLVVIGLVVGAVLLGRELIGAAQVRATITQIEQFNTAVNTFRVKYEGLPGDLANAANFGFVNRGGTLGHGDGNGLLVGGNNGSGATSPACGETVLFWNDLSTAGLVAGKFAGADTQSGNCAASPQAVLPFTSLAGGAMLTVYSGNGANYYQLIGHGTAIDPFGGMTGYTATVSPMVESMIDQKLDDGFPLTGHVQAINPQLCTCGDPTSAIPAAPAAGVCVSNIPGNPYNTSTSTGGNTPACGLSFQFH